ncbi:hypothetical protein [Hymenobacter ruricola]|uniref:Outer membrane protein beta-barrel domain-containing protein n=1 Tax=Hymenobacter ruricola TaxID=2791023 RepID=A0ABS0I6N7_9BACT|nr:hypothetical protein [Hymenobacter ruricola]MBF9222640.1 hypothetical protein [Hymenobacter ruricola]
MSANPIDDNTTPKTTGSLEELFRHHLGEEAAVPPRPMLWDQIDNSLLIRQNEVYRKRLVATRWVAAASLLLATLAGTGWWAQHDSSFGGAEMAKVATPPAAGTGPNANSATASTSNGPAGDAGQLNGANLLPQSTNGRATSATAGTYAAQTVAPAARRPDATARYATTAASSGTGFGAASVGNGFGDNAPAARPGAGAARVAQYSVAEAGVAGSRATIAREGLNPAAGTSGTPRSLEAGTVAASAAGGTLASVATIAATGTGAATETAGLASTSVAALTQASAAADAQTLGLLAVRPAALSLAEATALPKGLAAVALPEPAPTEALDKWHYGLSYTAGLFNPNVNFSRQGIEPEFGYNPALGPDSPALTEAAAAQYRENLRPGLSQRIALLATRHLKGHWSASTGLEFTQASARSASTASFVGEQLYDLGSFTNGALRTTDFRYRIGGVPFEVAYSNPVKRGWSFYGRLGGVVSALLGVRSEVAGEPEATKTYSVLTTGGPYRRVLGSLRGAAGAQYRPVAGNWALTLGPVAEMGLVPLNAHPAQSFLAQSRPYSFGMEAGVEFGR